MGLIGAPKDSNSPAITSDAYDRMLPVWDKIDTVLAGTEAMRAASTTYLPQHPKESDEQYVERKAKAVLFNLSEITLDQWVGKPFSDVLTIDESTPDELENILRYDVDLQGNNINVFARKWFKGGLAKALGHVYVDMPRVDDTGVRTRANDKDLKPYMIFYKPEDLFFLHSVNVGGQEIITHIRIMEYLTQLAGFAEVVIPQIRAVTLMYTDEETPKPYLSTTLYQLKDKSTTEWVAIETFTVDFPEIPLVTFYADRVGVLEGKPPLLDLVNINVNHWQTNSDHDVIITVAQFPILAGRGVDENTTIKIGPKEFLSTENPDGRFYYVEHTGKAIESGAKRLQYLEDQMSNYGAEFLKKRPGSLTATARALDSAEATSPLQDATMRFNDALNRAIRYLAMWLGIEPKAAGEVKLITDFGPEEASQAYLQELGKARERRDLSRKRWILEMQRNGGLAEDFDEKANLEELEAELNEITGDTNLDIDPNAPDPKDEDSGKKPDTDEA